MKYVKLFENFINEELDVPMMRSQTDILSTSLNKLKKEKLVKGQRIFPRQTTPNVDLDFLKSRNYSFLYVFRFKYNDVFVLCNEHRANITDVYNVITKNELKTEQLDLILPEKITGSAKKISYELERKNIVQIKKSPYYEYEVSYNEKESTITDLSKEFTSYKEYDQFIEETGLEMISTSRQIKNGTFIFGFPAEFAIPKDEKSNIWIHKISDVTSSTPNRVYDHLVDGVGIYSTGYIRRVNTFPCPYRIQPVGTFSINTKTGWIEALEKAKAAWNKIVEKYKDQGLEIILGEENRKTKRGFIKGRKFGF
jgi:hypothetical protein